MPEGCWFLYVKIDAPEAVKNAKDGGGRGGGREGKVSLSSPPVVVTSIWSAMFTLVLDVRVILVLGAMKLWVCRIQQSQATKGDKNKDEGRGR